MSKAERFEDVFVEVVVQRLFGYTFDDNTDPIDVNLSMSG